MKESPALTLLLRKFADGDRLAAEAALREVMPKLRQVAARELGREYQVAPVSATELIHEVWLRNFSHKGWHVESRAHFYAFAAQAMRHVLVDMARQRLTLRRGGHSNFVVQDLEAHAAKTASPEQLVRLGELMDQLERRNSSWARIAEMRYFAGFTIDEISEATGLSTKQVRTLWEQASEWLRRRYS